MKQLLTIPAIAIFLAFFFVTIGSETAQAQDPEFTQYFANPLYLNPAFAGTARCPRMTMSYRNQWPAMSGSFVTTSAAYDQQVETLS